MISDSEISDFLDRLSIPAQNKRLLTWKESVCVLETWKIKFAKNSITKHGKWPHKNFFWHAYSYRECESLAGAKANLQYEVASRNHKEDYFIMLHEGIIKVIEAHKVQLPGPDIIIESQFNFSDLTELYIFPKSFDWTYIITHEVDFGPYFAASKPECWVR